MRTLRQVIKMLESIEKQVGSDVITYILDHEANIICDIGGVVKIKGKRDIAVIGCLDSIKKLTEKTDSELSVKRWN